MDEAGKGGGRGGLQAQAPPGALPRLDETQHTTLKDLMSRYAEAYGFRRKMWTCARVAELIRNEFGVGYHLAHISRLVRAHGLYLEKPMRRANQRDEEAIER